jgi:hypothetical protein
MAIEKDAENESDELLEEYHFAQLEGGVRGKYASVSPPAPFWCFSRPTWRGHSRRPPR